MRLALVAIPVEIYPAAKSAPQVSFRQIHRKSGQRVRYEKTVPGIGPVKAEDIAKGFEVDRNEYVLLDEEDLQAVRLESRRTLELTQFVHRDEIDDMHFDTPYYVVPADELAEEAYIVLRDALRKAQVVGLGQLAMRGREHVVALKPCGRGMILETLRYADELNKAASYFRDIDDVKPEPEMLELASALIERKRAPFDPSMFRDSYVDAVLQLVEEKRRRGTVETKDEPQPKGGNVIDLMAALRKSVEAKAGKAPAGATSATKARPAGKSAAKPTPAKSASAKSASGRKRSAA